MEADSCCNCNLVTVCWKFNDGKASFSRIMKQDTESKRNMRTLAQTTMKHLSSLSNVAHRVDIHPWLLARYIQCTSVCVFTQLLKLASPAEFAIEWKFSTVHFLLEF